MGEGYDESNGIMKCGGIGEEGESYWGRDEYIQYIDNWVTRLGEGAETEWD